jgi:hypothetical protein
MVGGIGGFGSWTNVSAKAVPLIIINPSIKPFMCVPYWLFEYSLSMQFTYRPESFFGVHKP